jgi:hypothetical protein
MARSELNRSLRRCWSAATFWVAAAAIALVVPNPTLFDTLPRMALGIGQRIRHHPA